MPDIGKEKIMYQTVNGLTIRSVDYKEADKILTVLTDARGCITVKAGGVRRKGSRLKAPAQLFTFSRMTLYESKGRFSLQEAEVLEQFSGLQADLTAVSLASYFAEVLSTETEDAPSNGETVRLALNCLYALSKGLYPPQVIKAAFELRYIALAGYAPDLSRCALCGKESPVQPVAALEAGVIRCKTCPAPQLTGAQAPLSGGALAAARYLLACDLKKLFSFQLPEEDLRKLAAFTEGYLLTRMERTFRTLDFYKSVGEP